ncbi:SDR family NAD(P)-dependent oxidoreductase [Streptomyces sp. CA-249302]|uniref:SDR family NAD(P)-dependent oxidoreductase n=1 Tax=Streptomyces sp. CA-249302 TaxID=3240058 RepID=UPI003D90F9F4
MSEARVAVVTGGAAGLGRACVERLGEDGYRVVVGDLDRDGAESPAKELGPDVRFRPTDVAVAEQVRDLVGFAVSEFGALHLMVNNAGVSGVMHGRLLDEDFADFQHVLAVNLLGVMTGTREAARHMAANGGGSIVNVSSIGGIQAGASVLTYRASKAAVVHFSKCAALDLAEHGIRVNCVAPGGIPTGLLASATASDEMTDRVRAHMAATQPLQRLGTPRDVAEAVAYLGGSRSLHVTGTVLTIDGGTSAGPKPMRPAPAS